MTLKQGMSALKKGNFGAAISLLSAAVKSDPNNGSIYYSLAQALKNDGRKGEAIMCLSPRPHIFTSCKVVVISSELSSTS